MHRASVGVAASCHSRTPHSVALPRIAGGLAVS